MTWTYKGQEFTSADISDNIGFVYIIEDLHNNMKYVGKKVFTSTRRLPPLKGKTRRRTKLSESDWMSYYGSSEDLKARLDESGPGRFKREILHLCKKKGEMSYMELKEQVLRDVLLKPEEYYNGIVQAKIHRTHVSGLIGA